MRRLFKLLSAVLVLSLALPASGSTNSTNVGARVHTLEFNVYLNDDPIGFHRFVVKKRGEAEIIESNASFKVKFLVFNAYEYQHENREVWRRGCLQKMQSRTDDNGEVFSVTAEKEQDQFAVTTLRDSNQLQGCVKTFAYWDPDLIVSKRLLNAQTGEYMDVTVENLGSGKVSYKGTSREAVRYRIMGENLKIDVWYSPRGEWLALDSAKDGNLVRYRRKL